MFCNGPQAKAYYGVTSDTLRRWADSGKIESIRTDGGHRRYFIPDPPTDSTKSRIIYTRVSSRKQQKDLQNQTDFLSQRYPDYEVIHDIGSGVDYNRKGLSRILERVLEGSVEEVVVANKDRLVRFGYELLETIFDRCGTRITVAEEADEISDEQELAEDIISIITVFTARYHGRRSYKTPKAGKKTQGSQQAKSESESKGDRETSNESNEEDKEQNHQTPDSTPS